MGKDRSGRAAILRRAILIVALGAAGVFAWGFPRWEGSPRASNERSASTSLKILSSAEADFRINDRDGNGVNDFWTGDVAGLYRLGLIERGMAEADTSPLNPLVRTPIPFHGYYFEVLNFDNSVTPPDSYRKATDKKSGKVHNTERFGFVAYPAGSGEGKYYFMINENSSVFRAPATIPRPTNWFTLDERRNYWSMPQ